MQLKNRRKRDGDIEILFRFSVGETVRNFISPVQSGGLISATELSWKLKMGEVLMVLCQVLE